jgi:hypothetical protein
LQVYQPKNRSNSQKTHADSVDARPQHHNLYCTAAAVYAFTAAAVCPAQLLHGSHHGEHIGRNLSICILIQTTRPSPEPVITAHDADHLPIPVNKHPAVVCVWLLLDLLLLWLLLQLFGPGKVIDKCNSSRTKEDVFPGNGMGGSFPTAALLTNFWLPV